MLLGVSVVWIHVHADGDAELHHLVEVVDGMLHVLRDGAAGEGLEVEQTGIAPPLCVAGLDAEFALNLAETLGINEGLHGIPDGEEAAGLVHALVVLMAEFVPEDASALHLVVPGHVVEPGDEVLGARADVVVETAERLRILLDVGRACEGAVEAHADRVGLVVVGRGPVDSHPLGGIPRLGSVVVGTGKDVVDAEGHHVVDACLAASKHHAEEGGIDRWGIECGFEPFFGDVLRGQRWIPGRTAEGIPVGLSEVMAAPGDTPG